METMDKEKRKIMEQEKTLKEKTLSFLGKLQLDLIKRKKAIASERVKFEGKLNRLVSSAKPYGNRLSYNVSRDKKSLEDKIHYLKSDETKIQLEIDAIIYARQFMRNH